METLNYYEEEELVPQEESIVGKVIKGVAIGYGGYLVARSAFSHRSREAIRERDQWTCKEHGEDCNSVGILEAAHINHDKSYHNYDHPSNGRLLCTEAHLDDHINRHGRNGLPEHQNAWAIDTIKKRLAKFLEYNGADPNTF